jgi:hypothetical protein
VDPATQRLSEVLSREPTILVAYLFGSRARGEARAGSDYDVAVLTTSAFSFRDRMRLAGDLGSAAGRRVDLVHLNHAAPLITYEVVRDGRPLLVRDESALNDFERRAFFRYCDTKRLRAVQDGYLRERALERIRGPQA